MKKITLLFFVLFAIGIYSCDESNLDSVESTELDLDAASKNGNNGNKNDLPFSGSGTFESITDDPEYCGEELVCTFWAGQNIDAGSVTVTNDGEYLYVKVYSKAGFQDIEENIKMWIGLEVPDRRPPSGQFPYKVTEDGDTHIFKIELSTLPDWNECGDEYIIIVHGDVLTEEGNPESGETAYGGCDGTDGQPWWAHMEYTTQCCELTQAWLYKESSSIPNTRVKCFEQTEAGGNKIFGFSNKFQNPYGGSYPVYANVGEDCDVSAKIKVGTLLQYFGNIGESDEWIRFKFQGEGDYANAKGVMSIWVGWPDPVDNGIFVGENSGLFLVDVVDGFSSKYIDVDSWPGTRGDVVIVNGKAVAQYFVVANFKLEK